MSKKKGGKRLNKKQIAEMLQTLFQQNPNETFSFKQVFKALKLDTHPTKMLAIDLMEEMAWDDYLSKVSDNSYRLNLKTQVQEGTFIRKANGKNSFQPDDGGTPVFVSERNSLFAMNGDRVKVTYMARREKHIKEAMVVEILSHKRDQAVGKLKVEKDYAFLITEGNIFVHDILIPKKKLKGGKDGEKAVVKITQWPSKESKNIVGEVIDVLGKEGDNNVEMHAILAQYGLPYKYPQHVEAAAEKIEPGITPEEIARREDFRDVFTCTIDPKDAKDFDDALSIQKKGKNWEVGVHIADVSHYVKEGSVIDKEAVKRATSVYLVDRTIPMLPERLCNDICSLRADEDKLTHSVIFEMTPDAKVKKYDICHTVIRSNRRFDYDEAQRIIETGQGDLKDEILTLNDLAQKLRARRFDEGGSVAFNREELKFDIDEQGHPIAVVPHVSLEANQLIEEFMLLANRTVAAHIGKVPPSKKAKAFVYRVHESPDAEKLGNLAEVAAHFGYKIKTTGSARDINKSINRMLEKAAGQPEEQLLAILAIRSMAKAVYSATNIGHYGLAFDYYTHFTSPIRRYPDMMVHRLLDRYAVKGSRSANLEQLEQECQHCSSQEALAAQAERASIKYKAVEFMGDRLGEVFAGHISGVTEWGIYVEVDETHCEGMVPIRDLDDDFYEYDERNYLVRGRRSRKAFQLGDPITIQVARANLITKQLDFVVVDDKHPAGTHRIDREPITEQNAGVLARMSRDDKRRAEHEGGSASRRQKRGHRGNSTRRDVVEGGGKRGTKRGRSGKSRSSNKRRR